MWTWYARHLKNSTGTYLKPQVNYKWLWALESYLEFDWQHEISDSRSWFNTTNWVEVWKITWNLELPAWVDWQNLATFLYFPIMSTIRGPTGAFHFWDASLFVANLHISQNLIFSNKVTTGLSLAIRIALLKLSHKLFKSMSLLTFSLNCDLLHSLGFTCLRASLMV